MTKPYTTFWPPIGGNLAAISSLQAYAAAGPINIGSNLPFMPNVSVNTSGVYEFNNVIRSVSFTSAANLSGLNLVITGLGAPGGAITTPLATITETLAGPNANTVQTVNIYKKITSITISGTTGANTISVGFGTFGMTDYVFMDNNRTAWYATASGYAAVQDTNLTYTFFESLIKPETPNNYFGNLDVFPYPIPASTLLASTANAISLVNMPTPVALVWATVTDHNTASPVVAPASTNNFYFTVVQQGIGS